jgi:hypothetical protein
LRVPHQSSMRSSPWSRVAFFNASSSQPATIECTEIASPSGPITKARYRSGSNFRGRLRPPNIRTSQASKLCLHSSSVQLRTGMQMLSLTVFRRLPHRDAAQKDEARKPRHHEPKQEPLKHGHRPPLLRTRRTLTLVNGSGFCFIVGTCHAGTAVVHRKTLESCPDRRGRRAPLQRLARVRRGR